MAWGMLGHRVVGEIASSYLTSKTRTAISKILGTESIAIASNWADFIKSDTTYKYLNTWHYMNPDSGLNYSQLQAYLKADTETDVYTKTNFIVKELKNKNLSKDKKVFYLRLLIHFIGDLHQPLHVSAKGSNGGNSIKVSWFNESSNLHRVWDEQLPESQKLSYTEYANVINHTTPKQRLEWQQQPFSLWMYESYKISERIHNDIKGSDKLSYNYNFKFVQTMNEQLLKGGVRLAGLLNEIFG
jgi:hypothetical protein